MVECSFMNEAVVGWSPVAVTKELLVIVAISKLHGFQQYLKDFILEDADKISLSVVRIF